MDILNIQALIKEGKIVSQSDVNPDETYLQVGVFQPGNRKSGSSNPNAYASYAISVSDIAPPPSIGTINNSLYSLNPPAGIELGINTIAFGKYAANYSYASDSNFLGFRAGYQTSNTNSVNMFGYQAGMLTNTVSKSNFIGESVGYGSLVAGYCNMFGAFAGFQSSFVNNSNFFGQEAGAYSVGCYFSNFLGFQAGISSTGDNVIALGYQAGKSNTKSGQFIISNSSIPVYAGLAAATTALSGGSIGSTYLWIDSTDNNTVKAFRI